MSIANTGGGTIKMPRPDWAKCSDCRMPLDQPWRSISRQGKILFGCVSSQHNNYADKWHDRPEAKKLREHVRMGFI